MILGCVFAVLWVDLIYLISATDNHCESIKWAQEISEWAQEISDRIENWFWPTITTTRQKEIPQSLPINWALPDRRSNWILAPIDRKQNGER